MDDPAIIHGEIRMIGRLLIVVSSPGDDDIGKSQIPPAAR
jgi:hypothetical protein